MNVREKFEPKRPAPIDPALPICWPVYNDEDEQKMLAEVAEWVDWTRWRFTGGRRPVSNRRPFS